MDDKTAIDHMQDERAGFNVRYYRHGDATGHSLEVDEAYQHAIHAIEKLAKVREFIESWERRWRNSHDIRDDLEGSAYRAASDRADGASEALDTCITELNELLEAKP